ncbi:DUF6544 family protein [Devosia sp.]|uniref:DUF6544 family protein n=1 Tax=Devosia sp. TaxID=1871048 RepID=UPI001AD5A5EE|nr:DUF6544 family protein [Devosia sp.]MBN9309747.1 hypothetical protein [Devosia sp.]
MRMGQVIGLCVLAALALAGAYALWSGAEFEGRIAALRARLEAGPAASATPDLPAIVRTYAERAGGRSGGPAVIHLTHSARLATAVGQPPSDIAADQWASTAMPGIVWRGHGSMLGIPLVVLDSYVDGHGLLEARIGGAIRAAYGAGGPFDKGELQRYLSELPLLPDAILNNSALRWRQVDATSVEVTANTPDGPASARFSFDAAGDIVGIVADDRPMTVGNSTRPTRWVGTYAGYRQFGRYRVPSHGEVGWQLPEGLFTYWRGEVTSYEPWPRSGG